MPDFSPTDPDFEMHVRSSFAGQQLMKTIGAEIINVSAGEVQIMLPYNLACTQQNLTIHAGIITALADGACGFAAATLIPADSEMTSVEFKVNFLYPARGEKFIGIGKVIKPGRTLTVCQAEIFAYNNGEEKLIALMQATMMALMKN